MAEEFYIAAEGLSGDVREYLRCDRKAIVGDYVLVTKKDCVAISTVAKITRLRHSNAFYAEYIGGDPVFVYDDHIYVHPGAYDAYSTLIPAKADE